MPLMDLINQAEITCKLHPEKAPNLSFEALKDNVNNPVVELKKLQDSVKALKVKKNIIEVLSHVILSQIPTGELPEQSLLEIDRLENAMQDLIKQKSSRLLSWLSSSFTEEFKKQYTLFVDMADEEISKLTKKIKFTPDILKDDHIKNVSVDAKTSDNVKLVEAVKIDLLPVNQAAVVTETKSNAEKKLDKKPAESLVDQLVKRAIENAKEDLVTDSALKRPKKSLQLQIKVYKEDAKEDNSLLEKKLSDLEKKFADLEKQHVRSKKYILVDRSEYNRIQEDGIYQELVNCYSYDLKLEMMYAQMRGLLKATRQASPEMTEKLLSEIDKYYKAYSHFYRDRLFEPMQHPVRKSSSKVSLFLEAQNVEQLDSKISQDLKHSYDDLKEDINKLKDLALRHGNFEIGVYIGLYSINRLKDLGLSNGLIFPQTPSQVNFFQRSKQEMERRTKITEFFEEIIRRSNPQELQRVAMLNKKHGEFSRRNVEAIKEQASEKLGHNNILRNMFATFGVLRR